jgi:hypothetical protein
MRTFALALVASLALMSGLARAQDYEAAGRHFSAAQEAFSRKHFKVAATEYQAAFDITKDPLLLYNIGEAWQKAGEGKKSVAAYEQYLKAQPTAQDKTEVQARIKSIKAAKFKIASQSEPGDDPAAVAKAPPPPVPTPPPPPPVAETPPPPPPENPDKKDAKLLPPPDFDQPAKADNKDKALAPPDDKPAKTEQANDKEKPVNMPIAEEAPASKMRVAAWIGVAATVAVLTTGAILGLAAQSRADEITRRFYFVDANGQPLTFDATQQADFKNLKDEGNLYNGLAIGFFAGAGALAITTAVLFGVDYKNQKDKEKAATRALRFQPTLGPNGGGFMTGWKF